MRISAPTIDEPAYFERLADVEAGHWWSLGLWRLASYWLDESLRGRRGLRALDVGCGTGLTAVRLSRREGVGSVVGVDPNPDALRHARSCHGFPLVRGSALDLPFGADVFDVLTCFDVFQHLPERGDRRAAVEIARVLAPGGVAVVRSNGRGFARERSAGYRLNELVDVFSGSGLSVVRATYANGLPSLIQEARGLFARSGTQGHPSGGGLQIRVPPPGVNRVMGGVSGVEAWLAGKVGVRLPFGHSTMVMVHRVPRR